jgi:ATP synthase F1 epsilon subunit
MLRFQLVASTGTKFNGEAYEVLVPTRAGTVGIFEDHMPMISAAQPGVLSVRKKQNDPDSALEHFAVSGGVLATKGQEVRFMADDVTASEEASETEAQAALKRAEQLVASAPDQVALQDAQRQLAAGAAKLRVAQLKRRHHR